MSASRLRTVASARLSTTAPLSLSMISVGVSFGTHIPLQMGKYKPVNPASSTVGMSGAALAKLRQRTRQLVEYEIDLPRNQGLHRWSGAAIGDELNMGAGKVLEQDAAEMGGSSDPRRSSQDLLRVGFHPGDQFVQVFCRHLFLRDNNRRVVGKKCHRL